MKRVLALVAALAAAVVVAAASLAPGLARAGEVALPYGSVRYLSYGQGEDTLVFLHGWSCSSSFWREQVPSFASSYRLILPDLPGHGGSAAPRLDYTQTLFADAVAAVMDHAGARKAVLVAHSMGLSVARQFIMRHHDRCKALIIVDGAYVRPPELAQERSIWLQRHLAFVDNFQGKQSEKFRREFIASMFDETTPEPLRNKITKWMLKTPEYVAHSVMENFFAPEIWSRRPLKQPTLAIYAVSDDMPEDNKEYLNQLFPNMDYHLWPDVGHFIMMERPKAFNRTVKSFLDRLRRRGAL